MQKNLICKQSKEPLLNPLKSEIEIEQSLHCLFSNLDWGQSWVYGNNSRERLFEQFHQLSTQLHHESFSIQDWQSWILEQEKFYLRMET